MKRQFKVRATWTENYEATVEAEDGCEANLRAVTEMEQDDFTMTGHGQWWIEDDEPAEMIKPSHWAVDPDYPVSDWQAEVARDDTRQSYVEWVASCRSLLEAV